VSLPVAPGAVPPVLRFLSRGMAPARRRAGAIEIVALKCISVVNRLPQALGKLGLGDGGDKDGGDTDGDAPAAAAGGGGGADRRTCGGGGLRVAAAEELEPGEGEGERLSELLEQHRLQKLHADTAVANSLAA
jgi:hypothetical protein